MGDHIFELSHRDGRFIRAAGVFVLTRKSPEGRTEALFVGEADPVASAAIPGHPLWARAMRLGMNGMLVVLEQDPDRRRRFARDMAECLDAPLNRETLRRDVLSRLVPRPHIPPIRSEAMSISAAGQC
jgi:hypothetical protein